MSEDEISDENCDRVLLDDLHKVRHSFATVLVAIDEAIAAVRYAAAS